VLAALWGGCAVLIRPPAIVSYQMLQPPAASFAPFIARLYAPNIPPLRTPEDAAAALVPVLSSAPSSPPSQASLLPQGGAVVLVTIDCFRADLLESDRHEAAIPNLSALRRASAQFTQARSPGNLTIVALSSIFTGRFESQLAWGERQTPHKRYLVPALDPAPRFPEVLAAAGVPSTTIVGAEGYDGGSGIVRGFTEERSAAPEVGLAHGEDIVASAIDRIEHHQGGPLFLYLHLFDAHDPYDRAGTQGTEFERYLRELTLVDREVGRLVAAVDRRFGDRSVLIVSADHGEAFGEHHTARHGTMVYDEVVRVPLLVRGHGIAPRVIADSVSTIDLGPTVMDLFRVSTPPSFLGQSLVPLLAGEPFVRARPVAIESRGMAALVDGGFKILRSKHYDTVELYDLGADPGETDNLFREDNPAAVARLRQMDAFFADAAQR
jgi:arylsulfatase A-like enzyme